ncbi:hypothetical protein EDB85DRAFT_1991582, partial [Lactarius pseudohatsudake]
MVNVCISSAWPGLALPLCKHSVSWVGGMCPLFRFCATTVTHMRGVVLATLLSLLAVPVVDIDDRITISQGIPLGMPCLLPLLSISFCARPWRQRTRGTIGTLWLDI